jgi:signal transduction histidine kinase
MLLPLRPPSSLARSTLIKMGVRVALIIALATFCSYLHMLNSLRTEALVRLERSVLERAQREQAIFVQARDNQVVLKMALEERLQRAHPDDAGARFDSLFARMPDGSIRTRPEGFDGTRLPCVFVPRGVTLDDELRRRILAGYDVLLQYGPAFHTRFTDTFITLPEGPLILYWPERPTWCQDTESDFSVVALDFFPGSRPENNPLREMTWSGIFADPVAGSWVVVASTPLDLKGRHVATLSHDVLLDELVSRTTNDHLPGTYNILFRDDGQLIAHPKLRMKSGADVYNILSATGRSAQVGTLEQQSHLRAIFARVKDSAPEQTVLELPEYDEYIAVARLEGPGWNFVTVLPAHVVSSTAFEAARYVLVFGLASLLVELIIMSWVLRQQLSHPLQAFTQATDQVAAGDFKVSLKTSRDDELGRLAHGFELMAQEVQRREAALRQVNEGLESRIEERTRELQEKNLKLETTLAQLEQAQAMLVEKEKLASLGALVAGIAHEIKNPLNFVNNFAQLSVDVVEELREELNRWQVGPEVPSRQRLSELLECLEQNVRKIDEHGKRADSIVRNMQMHSRSRSGERTPTDLNALLEEHLELAFGGMQATHPGLEVAIRKELDSAVGRVELVSQDFGRALLNVISNSLYAVAEKKHQAGVGFTPEVAVSSRSVGPRVEIRIRDNGIGIPRKVHDKIFNPFFTTKPAGSGTGLGLSIAYDIVVRQHHGEIRLESTEGQYTECLILLARSQASA